MKKIIFALIALMMLGSLLVADQVIKTKEGEKESLFSGYAEIYDNNTNTSIADAGIKINFINLYNSDGYKVGTIYSVYEPITDTFGYFNCPQVSSHVAWRQWHDENGFAHFYNFDDVAILDFTYRGTRFWADKHEVVHLKFIQGY